MVSDIGYTANSVSYAKNSTKEMSDNLGLTGKLGKSQATTNDSLKSGDVLVSKLATIKLYADSGKTQLAKTLSKADPMIFLGEKSMVCYMSAVTKAMVGCKSHWLGVTNVADK